jgi:aromatic-L-amino-acid decarboxylase
MQDATKRSLEPSSAEMRSMVKAATERIVAHIESLPSQAASDIEGGPELSRSLAEDAPETGEPFETLLELVVDKLALTSFTNAGPGFMAYIPGGGLFESAVADFVANGINRYVTVWTAAPGLVQLETNVINWFCGLVDYPKGSGGYLSSGGSIANFTAVFTARRERLPEDFLGGMIYVSSQIHHSVTRAATLAGFPESSVRTVPVDKKWRIRVDELQRLITTDRRGGRTPFMIVGSAGTTNTGAIDDLERMADVAGRERLWFHVDAAYGGFFTLTDRGRRRMAGIELSDSVTLDPHKGLFLPYGTGCLLVRDAGALKRAHTVHADYMPSFQESDDLVDFCEISPELSRDFRGLRAWLPIKMYGLAAFREALDEKLDLTEWVTRELRKTAGIEIVAEPQLSVVAFRLALPDLSQEEANQVNEELLERINSQKRVFLTGTVLDGQFVVRICILNFRTHLDRMEMCLEDIRTAILEVTG